ncbi:mercuric reductase [Chloroflexia bacterium SDU3-3]|nr:mercuric reductase [Chloroflexia bacterium SDU3-3]
METHYHTIVIGSGQGGGPLATTLARAGHRTALVERAHIGGTCVNEGCTPTKTMVASARVAHLTRRGADYGVRSGGMSIDMVRVRERKRVIVDSFRGGSERQTYATPNLDVIWGDASFSGPRELRVALREGGTATLTADQIVISTGGRPAPLDVPGADMVPALDSTSIMELDSVPEHLVVVGGGYIALEFGQMFRRFGSHVTIIQRGAQLLPREDADIAQAVAGILHQDGVQVLLGASPTRVERLASGVRVVVRTASGGEREVDGSHLLVAAGRVPNTDTLNLAAAGIEADKHGFITVDGRLATSAPGVYAIGDVKGGPAFTHIAYDDFRILRANMLHGGEATADGRMVPYTVFTDPQLGRVGLTEREAREQGRRIKVASMPMSSVARALETDETRGLMKALVDADSGQILGCAILGVEGGEIMSMIQLAMMGGLPYTALRDATFAHPTFAESLNNLFTTIEE